MNLPDEERLIKVYGGKCQECGFVVPVKNMTPELRATERKIEREWERAGVGHLIQKGFPKEFPAWLVRKGFACTVCYAPDMLIQLSPDPRDAA